MVVWLRQREVQPSWVALVIVVFLKKRSPGVMQH